MPDSWLEALLRPIAMAYPGGSIYVETIAPDFRFVFVIGLALCWLAWRISPQAARARTLGLLAFCALSFVPWLATSGNGRYFTPVLLLAGPLCIALLHHLPISVRARLGLAGIMLALQAFLVYENEPWHSWGLVEWRDAPAFDIQVPADLQQTPATYVTINGISYSLIAPRFHPKSRWISLASQHGQPADSADGRRTRAFLAASGPMLLLFPAPPGLTAARDRPPQEVADAIDLSLSAYDLMIAPTGTCRILPSAGLTSMGRRAGATDPPEAAEQRGFWLCPLIRQVAAPDAPRQKPSPDVEAAFEAVERACPRLFPPGQAGTVLLPAGAGRFYVSSDMRLYVFNDGRVMYKYMRALNAVDVGTMKEVAAPGFKMDCDNVRGRAGLPWQREI